MTRHQYAATELMAHQTAGVEMLAASRQRGEKGFALLCEQGTGKTLMFLEEALELYALGQIDAVFVMAPNGVQENWVINEIPKHVPPSVPWVSAYYVTPGDSNRRERAALERVLASPRDGEVTPLRFLAVNWEALLTDHCFKFCEAFLRKFRPLVIGDESQKIKSGDSRRTKRALNLRKHGIFRRIGSGTMITQSPLDVFTQFEFMEEGACGTDSFVAFRAEYCQLLPHGHGLMRHVLERMERASGRKMSEREKELRAPPMIEKDEMGRPIYKNLDKLQRIVAARSYRVLKEDVLDLPPKVYETRFFHMSKAQRVVYERMAEEFRYILEDNTVLTASKLVAMSKLRQITSGFLLLRDGTVSYVEDNPRIALLKDMLEDEVERGTQGIIWAFYKEEIRNIHAMVRKLGMTIEMVNGDTPMGARRKAMDEFQAGRLQWIVAHQETMGTGFTLTNAERVIYYSNDFKLDARLQSEDRAHRIGTKRTVLYEDVVAIDTRDDDVVYALQHKLDTATLINGDPERQQRWASHAGV